MFPWWKRSNKLEVISRKNSFLQFSFLNWNKIVIFLSLRSWRGNVDKSAPLSQTSHVFPSIIFYGFMMVCAIWYHLYNLKNVKNIYGGMFFLIKLHAPASLLKVTRPHGCFSHFLNCTNTTKSCKLSYFHHLRTHFDCEVQCIWWRLDPDQGN